MKKLLFIALFISSSLMFAQKNQMGQQFQANFDITSAKTLGAQEYELTASGEAAGSDLNYLSLPPQSLPTKFAH